MPLIAKLFKEGDEQQRSGEKSEHDNGHSIPQNFPENPIHEYYEQFDQEHNDNDQDMLARPRPKKLVPDLPQKSHLRASKILDNLTLDLQDLSSTQLEDQESLYSNPHDSYLSSEEDGSASGDDYEDIISDYEGSDDKLTAATRRHSYEETARAVSFKCVKPQLVEINPSHSPATSCTNERRFSLASSRSQPILTTIPPSRNSSRPSLALQTFIPPSFESNSATHSFLSSDPFPTESPMSMFTSGHASSRNDTPSPQTARSEKTSSSWGSLRAVSRTIALARKKASMPKLNLAYTAGVVPKRASPIQSQGPSTSSSSISSAATGALPALSPRRRSQTFDRLIGISSREERRGSEYIARNEDWNTTSPDSTSNSSESTIRSSVVTASPVEARPGTSSAPSQQRPHLRTRSYTTSQASLSSPTSIYSNPPSKSSLSKSSSPIISSPTTTISSIKSSQPQPPSSDQQTSTSTQDDKETMKMRRMTAFPDYSRSAQVARERAEQRRESGFGENGTQMMNPSTAPVGNTYHDIMRSVAIGLPENRNVSSSKEKSRGSLGILGLRRGKGVKA